MGGGLRSVKYQIVKDRGDHHGSGEKVCRSANARTGLYVHMTNHCKGGIPLSHTVRGLFAELAPLNARQIVS